MDLVGPRGTNWDNLEISGKMYVVVPMRGFLRLLMVWVGGRLPPAVWDAQDRLAEMCSSR